MLDDSVKQLIEKVLRAKGTLEPWESVRVVDVATVGKTIEYSLVWLYGEDALWHGAPSSVKWNEKFRESPMKVINAFTRSIGIAIAKGRPIAKSKLAKLKEQSV